jgi:hypothetical protein
LQLKFKQPNDDGIKKLLATKLKEAKDKVEDLSVKLSHTEETLHKTAYTND